MGKSCSKIFNWRNKKGTKVEAEFGSPCCSTHGRDICVGVQNVAISSCEIVNAQAHAQERVSEVNEFANARKIEDEKHQKQLLALKKQHAAEFNSLSQKAKVTIQSVENHYTDRLKLLEENVEVKINTLDDQLHRMAMMYVENIVETAQMNLAIEKLNLGVNDSIIVPRNALEEGESVLMAIVRKEMKCAPVK